MTKKPTPRPIGPDGRPVIRRRPAKAEATVETKRKPGRPKKAAGPAKVKREKAGRPEFVAKLDDRTKVEMLVFSGMQIADIARVIGVSTPTLRKHFAEEIANGRAKVGAEIMIAQITSAKAGNVSAQKACLERARLLDVDESVRARGNQVVDAVMLPRAEKLGKKEERQRAAEAVTGKFAPPAGPTLVVSNR